MKKIITALSLCFIFIIMLISPVFFTGCSNKLNLHGLSIANFEDYTGIGAVNFGGGSISKAVYADNGRSHAKNVKLAGFNGGHCEEIKFKDDKGKVKKQKAKLLHFDAYTNFTLFSLTYKNYNFVGNDDYYYEMLDTNRFSFTGTSEAYDDSYLYILDHNNGKIYDMAKVYSTIEQMTNLRIAELRFVNLESSFGCPADPDSLLIKALFYSENDQPIYLFQLILEETDIKIVQRMDYAQYKEFDISNTQLYYNNLMDKFGNILPYGFHYLGLPYFQKADNTIKYINYPNATFKLGANSILYMNNNGEDFYLNKDGEFEKITLTNNSIQSFNYFIEHSNYAYLYRNKNVLTYTQKISKNISLVKATLDTNNVSNYTIEEKVIFVSENNDITTYTAIRDNFVYILYNKKFNVYNIETEELTPIESQYEFKSLSYNKNYNQIKFKAIDTTTMMEVDGYFTQDGEIVIGSFDGLSDGLNKVFIVKPLN